MKKIISWTLLLAMLLGMFAGCGSTQPQATDPAPVVDPTVAEVQPDDNLAGAIAYLKAMYKNAGSNTPADFERTAVVRVANIPYAVEWAVNVDENAVRIVPGEKSVTVDVNETVTADTPYTLTATITGTDGTTATASWEHFIPASLGSDYGAIVDMGYALEEGAALDGMATLAGVITAIDTPYDAGYKNITVTIQVEGREDKPIMCYRLKGEGAADLWIGDFITVKGTLKNYKGTIEFDAGCELVSVVKGENEKPVAPEDPAEILKAAYALSHGETLPYECTLTGVIVFVNAVYNPQYDNITVSMMVGDKGVRCFRLKGEDVETLNINDTITVTGTLMNYNGIIEFNSGCTLDDVIQRQAPQQPKDPKDVVEAAYNLEPGFYLPYYPTLTGTITAINTPYSAQYGNITVTMVVAGCEDKPIECFRMSGPGAETLEVGDVITVKGYLMNYEGKSSNKVEYSKPALLKVVKGEKPVEPEKPADPADGSTLSVADAIALGASKAHNEYTAGKYYVTGVITEVYNTTYGNMKIADEAGNILTVYGTYSADGSTRYDKMEVQPVAGDSVTVYGIIGQYNGTPQIKNGWITAHTPAGGSTEPSEPETPAEPETPDVPTLNENSTAAEILAACKTLEKGTYFEGVTVTVTGTVTWKGTYSATKGITFDLDNGLEVYRLISDVSDKIKEGDTVTVSGIPGNRSTTNGKPGLKNATLISWSGDAAEPELTGFAAQVEAAKALANGKYLEESSNVTGTVVSIAKYNETYHSYNFTLDVDGVSIYCYSMNADKALTLEVGDSVTINGYLTAYNGTPQFEYKKSTMTINKTASDAPEEPETPAVPEVDENSPFADIVAALKAGKELDFNYTVTGQIIKVYDNGDTKNVPITVDGEQVNCNNMPNVGAEWEAMAAGDIITVSGKLYLNSKGKVCVSAGTLIARVPAAG